MKWAVAQGMFELSVFESLSVNKVEHIVGFSITVGLEERPSIQAETHTCSQISRNAANVDTN